MSTTLPLTWCTVCGPSHHDDLDKYHGRDPEPQVTQSASSALEMADSNDSLLCDEKLQESSLLAVASMGDETISTIQHECFAPYETSTDNVTQVETRRTHKE